MTHRRASFFCIPFTLSATVFLVAVLTFCTTVLAPKAFALKPKKNEAAKLTACEIDICTLIVKKKPKSGWLGCNIGKTWVKKDIKKGADKKKISWVSGDAQCSLKVKLERAEIVGALTKSEHEIRMRRHYVDCVIENETGVDKVHVALAPKMKFKNGKVNKIWLNIKEVEGPPGISTLIWSTAQLEDGLGIFHGEMVKEVNKFMHRKCAKRLKEEKRKARKKEKKRLKAAQKNSEEKKSGQETSE